MAANDDMTQFEDWDRVAMASGRRWHRVADGKIGIGLESASKLSKIG
jgi:hypothetical protein